MFLDCAAGIAVAASGHSHPDVVRAIGEQAQQFLHMSGTDFYYDVQVRLAEELSAIAPMQGPRRCCGMSASEFQVPVPASGFVFPFVFRFGVPRRRPCWLRIAVVRLRFGRERE